MPSKRHLSADIIRDHSQGRSVISQGRDASKRGGRLILPGSPSNMTAGGEISGGKAERSGGHTRQEFISKQLSHLQDIKDATRGENTTFPCRVAAHYSPNKQGFLYQSKVIPNENKRAIYQH